MITNKIIDTWPESHMHPNQSSPVEPNKHINLHTNRIYFYVTHLWQLQKHDKSKKSEENKTPNKIKSNVITKF